jgi:Ni/Co efflux regulator RcnB
MKKLLLMSALVAALGATVTVQAADVQPGDTVVPAGDTVVPVGNGNTVVSVWRGGTANPSWQGKRFHAPVHYARPMGYQVRTWNGGDRLPPNYRVQKYYVNDYQQYSLTAPPAGYRYVRVDNDVVLVDEATGVVSSVIQGLYY